MTAHTSYTAPLGVYVLWHPDFNDGALYFKELFSLLCRNTEYPLQRGIGISIFQRSVATAGKHVPTGIPWSESERNMIILLVDDYLVTDENWISYVKAEIIKPEAKVLPIALTKNAFGFMDTLKNPQFLRLFEINASGRKEFKLRMRKLGICIMQELIKMLMANPEDVMNTSVPAKIKLFISHAKLDGEKLARDFMLYVRNDFPLDTFFDANDMPYGMDFPEHIKQELKNGVVVVFHTDMFASREWCMNEILWAKRYMTPILVVNCIEQFEKRSFPYMGNGPVIRLKKKINYAEVIHEAIYLTLKNLYAQHQVSKYVTLYWQKNNTPLEMGNTPELVHFESILSHLEEKQLKELYVIYPDPPLGLEENKLLNSIHKNVHFLTPLCLPGVNSLP